MSLKAGSFKIQARGGSSMRILKMAGNKNIQKCTRKANLRNSCW